MIIFLHGQDTFRMRQKLHEIVRHYKQVHTSGLNLTYLDCAVPRSESSQSVALFDETIDAMKQVAMFQEKRLHVIIDPFSAVQVKEKLLQEIARMEQSSDITVLCEQGKINKKDALFVVLQKRAQCQEFKLLEDREVRAWIRRECARCGFHCEPNALDMLGTAVGNDLWRMAHEIQKLGAFANRRSISLQDVELLVEKNRETDIFKTIDAIASKNKKKALHLLHGHLEKGDSPLYLLSMICFQMRNLLIVKDLIEKHKSYQEIVAAAGLHPFVVKKSYWQAQKFTMSELKKIYQAIFAVDRDIKTGRIEPETALDLFVATI